MLLKNIYGENSHFPHFSHSLFAFCAFAWVFLCLLVLSVLLVLLVHAKSFRKKKNKAFKTALITSFILLLVKGELLNLL